MIDVGSSIGNSANNIANVAGTARVTSTKY